MPSATDQAREPIRLSRLLAERVPAAEPSTKRPATGRRAADGGILVAFGRDGDRDLADFRARVATLAAAVAERAPGRWLLYQTDAYGFAVGLLALAHAGSTAVLAPNAQPGTLGELADRVVGLLLPEALRRHAPSRLPVLDPLAALAPGSAPATLAGDPDRDRPLCELFTSGTTGAGKAVTKTLAHVEDEIEVLERTFGGALSPATRVFSTVSCQHLYGLLFRIAWPLATGRPLQADTLLRPEELLPRMGAADESVLVTTPAHLRRLRAPEGVAPLRARCRAVFSSGGPLDAPTAAAVTRGLGTAPFEIFGSTETGGVAWRRSGGAVSGDAAEWTLLDGVRASCDPESRCLVVRSPFVSTGVRVDLDGTAAQEARAPRYEFTMGDRARFVAGGRFELLGRSDRVVKIGEKRLSMPEMEGKLLAHPAVVDAAVVSFEQASATRVRAVVAIGDAGRKMLAEHGRRGLGQALTEHLARYFDRVLLPRAWRFVDELPRDAQGKTPVAALTRAFATEAAEGGGDDGARAGGSSDDGIPAVPARPVLPVVTAERCGELVIERSLLVPEDLAFLEGHFEGFPVVAGVVQLHWVMAAVTELLGRAPELRGMEALKFKDLLLPGQAFQMRVDIDDARERVHFKLWEGERVFSSGRCLLASATERHGEPAAEAPA
jgi:acyl-CoA synthetase (AMP-forming)/AMP-acid ligase II